MTRQATVNLQGLMFAVALAVLGSSGAAQAQFRRPGGDVSKKPVAAPAPRSALLTAESWQKAPLAALKPGELDSLIAKELQENKIKPAALTNDEQFTRRLTLDLTGELPLPADVREFVADKDPSKRARLIDRLLDSDEYARHWARYWRRVVSANLTDGFGRLGARPYEEWMFQQLKKNTNWGEIARGMIAAEGAIRNDKPDANGQAFFLLGHRGAEAANERAAETSRIFLGIQIQCAQCHDHPFDQWKRVQFHELASYFARTRERFIRDGQRIIGTELVSGRGEHEMPGKDDPRKSEVTFPRFLNGNAPAKDLGDLARRQALAKEITDKGNYWFAGAYVNRVWGVLMGQSFYEPVDDMGPQKSAVFAPVLTRLTGSFRGSDYDVKALFREIMNSETYQRQIRQDESADHLHFAAAYPAQLSGDALWQSLVGVLGNLSGGGPPVGRPGGGGFGRGNVGLEGAFKAAFNFDPSLRPEDVEGSIPQALLMMNSPAIQQKIRAQGTNLLGRILTAYPKDDEAIRVVYERTLARKPTDRELERCRRHIAEGGTRADAFEDILWALLNSTEFQTKR